MLHDVDLLGEKVGGHASAEDIWTSDTCFGIEELEPKKEQQKLLFVTVMMQ
jgi:hypothetical protein